MTAVTPGQVCAHHHLYSALARGMPAPPKTATTFLEVLEQIWWRLDAALDLEMIRWSAMLGALEALEQGTTAIIDHHESPNAIEGSLDVIAEACATVGVRVVCAYGVTDRHGADGARRGLEENRRFISAGGRGLVGIHATFTCEDETLAEAAALATELGTGVHIHVAVGSEDGGTAMLWRRGPLCIPARFGEKSCARHAESAREAGLELQLVTSLAEVTRIDLDTPEDAERVIESGRSCRTSELLRSFAK